MRLVKGSKEAREYMGYLRTLRRNKKRARGGKRIRGGDFFSDLAQNVSSNPQAFASELGESLGVPGEVMQMVTGISQKLQKVLPKIGKSKVVKGIAKGISKAFTSLLPKGKGKKVNVLTGMMELSKNKKVLKDYLDELGKATGVDFSNGEGKKVVLAEIIQPVMSTGKNHKSFEQALKDFTGKIQGALQKRAQALAAAQEEETPPPLPPRDTPPPIPRRDYDRSSVSDEAIKAPLPPEEVKRMLADGEPVDVDTIEKVREDMLSPANLQRQREKLRRAEPKEPEEYPPSYGEHGDLMSDIRNKRAKLKKASERALPEKPKEETDDLDDALKKGLNNRVKYLGSDDEETDDWDEDLTGMGRIAGGNPLLRRLLLPRKQWKYIL